MSAPGLTLLALAHAGGNAASFLRLAKFLRGDIRLLAWDLPGHGRRMGEPLRPSIPHLAQDLLQGLAGQLREPWAILGHSMGALVGHAVCLAREQAGQDLPCHLFVSGCNAPGHSSISPDLPDQPAGHFWNALKDFGGLPREIMAEPAILELFEPILRADLRAVTAYQPGPSRPLPLPITLLRGDQDRLSLQGMAAWSQWSSRPVARYQFPGDHFYLFQNLPEVAALINRLGSRD